MKKLLGIVVLGLLWCSVGFTKETLILCKDKSSGAEVIHGIKFDEMPMTHWNDQSVKVPMALLDGIYIWVEERDDLNDPNAGEFQNSRIINYFNRDTNELEKWFFPLTDSERNNFCLKIQEGKGISWHEDGPKFTEYQQKILNDLYDPRFKFYLNCSIQN